MSLDTAEPAQTSADDAPLRLDDAVSLLAQSEGVAPAGETPPEEEEEAEEIAPDQGEGDGEAPESEEDPASEEPAEDEEDEPESVPVIDPPKFWSSEEKATFAKAPPEVQQLVAAKDAEYSRQVSLAKEEAAEARKDASVIGEVRQVIDKHLERAQRIFQGKWDNIDWAQWAKEDVASYAAAREEFAAEQGELQKLQTAKAATEVEEHRQFLKDEGAKLRESGHILADPVKGPEAKKALVAYAEGQGLGSKDLAWAGATELAILHKAMLYDEAQSNLRKAPPTLKTAPQSAAKAAPVRPGTPPPPRKETAGKHKREVVGRAFANPTMDNAVAALLAMEKG